MRGIGLPRMAWADSHASLGSEPSGGMVESVIELRSIENSPDSVDPQKKSPRPLALRQSAETATGSSGYSLSRSKCDQIELFGYPGRLHTDRAGRIVSPAKRNLAK